MQNKYSVKSHIQTLEKETGLPQPIKPVPKSIWDTAGILKDRYTDLKKHLRKIRKEWA